MRNIVKPTRYNRPSMRRAPLGVVVLLLVGCASVPPSTQPTTTATTKPSDPSLAVSPPSVQYLSNLQDRIKHTREQMPALTSSAEAAAKRVVAGRHLYVAGAQADFPKELLTRAGGLMGIAPPPKMLNRGDVILYAVPSRVKVGDQMKFIRWREQGAYIILFASKTLADNKYYPPDAFIDSGDSAGLPLADGTICPIDTVVNVINAWAWTGEFVAACTRLGKMPVLFQSYWQPGGIARGTRYRGQMFHTDRIPASVAPGELGSAYLATIACCLEELKREATPEAFALAGQWVRERGTQPACLLVDAHMFPEHYQDSRAPRPFADMSFPLSSPPPNYPPLVLMLGYQHPAQLIIDASYVYRQKLIYTSVGRGRDDNGSNIIYIDPRWPIEDACVQVKGYDIPILPASGVAQAAIYWSIMSEAVGMKPSY
jgi:hypothetical protein